MRYVIVTGMSGAGKRTAMKMLEDVGYYCVDNLPIPLVEEFTKLICDTNRENQKVALGLDVRTDQNFEDASRILRKLREMGLSLEIVFMDASDDTLIRRYKETRRLHPLQTSMDSRLEDSIRQERQLLEGIKSKADYVFDTSHLLTRNLKAEMDKIFVSGEDYNGLMINIVSFGFKHGIPTDADLVFDVRFLPNPYYIEELKPLTGNDSRVQEYVMASSEAEEFLVKLEDMLRFLIPGYVKEGKHQLVVGIGCTGGQHRSVTLADRLFKRMKDGGSFGITLFHRDI